MRTGPPSERPRSDGVAERSILALRQPVIIGGKFRGGLARRLHGGREVLRLHGGQSSLPINKDFQRRPFSSGTACPPRTPIGRQLVVIHIAKCVQLIARNPEACHQI